MKKKYKHLRINEDTWRLLNEVGRKQETYDRIIRRLLKKKRY
jgi:hypothetical protein